MPYYMRLFSRNPTPLSLDEINSCMPEGVAAELASGSSAIWESVLLQTIAGDAICLLERADPELVGEEVQQFVDELAGVQPKTGADWVASYLKTARQLIACQFLEQAFGNDYGHVPGETLWNIQQTLGTGILQSDNEGFSNEDGYGVVWQFSDSVSGPWSMAVLNGDGSWQRFEMNLGSKTQKAEFLLGKVPKGARLLD